MTASEAGRALDAEVFLARLAVTVPPLDTFRPLADLTALRRAADGTYYESNYERGRLLYALVAARRPSNILEFGTGRGFGALSMARALVELGLPGRVLTVDLVPPTRRSEWAFRIDGMPRTKTWSRAAFWEAHVPLAWRERVVSLTGRSRDVVRRWTVRGLPSIELAFVDGGHDFDTAVHDLSAACRLAGDRLGILADDYVVRPGFGVVAAVQDLLGGRVPVDVIRTSWGAVGAAGDGMAWIDLDGSPADLERLRARPLPARSWRRAIAERLR